MIPLVLVHGFMGGSAQWEAQHAALSKDRAVIALDLPGFGARSDAAALTSIPAIAAWAVAEVRGMGVERYHLLGHSMGGMVVQEMARLDQGNIGRLILYGTGAIGVLPGRFETIEESKARAAQDGASATARRISATWFLARAQSPAYPACAAIAEKASLDAINAGLDAMLHWRGDDFLKDITSETLVIWGDQDRTYKWEQVADLWHKIPDTRLAVIPDAAHAVHLEKPDIFNLILADFLREST